MRQRKEQWVRTPEVFYGIRVPATVVQGLQELSLKDLHHCHRMQCGARWAVNLQGLEDMLRTAPSMAEEGHRCAAKVSSTGGMCTHPWASALSTWENMACLEEWT